jgi:hypothetical protein
MTLHQLKKLLRKRANSVKQREGDATFIPGAKYLSSGVSRCAYRVGRYVVKAPHGWGPKFPAVSRLKRFGISPPKQWFVNGWVIQPYYKPLSAQQQDQLFNKTEIGFWDYDLHCGNLGVNSCGKVVAFDW